MSNFSNKRLLNELAIGLGFSAARSLGFKILRIAGTGYGVAAAGIEAADLADSEFLNDHINEILECKNQLRLAIARCIQSAREEGQFDLKPGFPTHAASKNLKMLIALYTGNIAEITEGTWTIAHDKYLKRSEFPGRGHVELHERISFVWLAAITANSAAPEIFAEEMSYDKIWGESPYFTQCNSSKAKIMMFITEIFVQYVRNQIQVMEGYVNGLTPIEYEEMEYSVIEGHTDNCYYTYDEFDNLTNDEKLAVLDANGRLWSLPEKFKTGEWPIVDFDVEGGKPLVKLDIHGHMVIPFAERPEHIRHTLGTSEPPLWREPPIEDVRGHQSGYYSQGCDTIKTVKTDTFKIDNDNVTQDEIEMATWILDDCKEGIERILQAVYNQNRAQASTAPLEDYTTPVLRAVWNDVVGDLLSIFPGIENEDVVWTDECGKLPRDMWGDVRSTGHRK